MNASILPSGAVDIERLLLTVSESLSNRAERADQSIDQEIHGPLLVRGDSDELTQVFWNLIENAIKYGRTGQTVNLRASAISEGSEIRVDVIDQGEGIDEQHLSRLTERFTVWIRAAAGRWAAQAWDWRS